MTTPQLGNAYDVIIDVNTGTEGSPIWTRLRFIRNVQYSFPPITQDVTSYEDLGSPNNQKTGASATASFEIQRYRNDVGDPDWLPEAEVVRKAADPDKTGSQAILEYRIYDRLGADEAYQFKATTAWARGKTGSTDDATATVNLTSIGRPTVITNPSSIQPIPVITSVSPTTGPAGTVVTITGTNLRAVTGVKFGTTDSVADVDSDTTVKTVVPAGGATGSQPITAINPGGASTPGTAFSKT